MPDKAPPSGAADHSHNAVVGFTGLGIMGRPMALNLLRAGYPLIVHNRTRAKEKDLVDEGAEAAATPQEVAERAGIVITMLPDSPDVEQVYLGEDGVIAGARGGQLLIDMSSIAPATAIAVSDAASGKGADMLDAPVSGGDVGARDGTLSIMVGGPEAAFERARPLFDVLGKTVVRLGEAGAGQTAKACNQMLVAITIEAVSEALVLASKAGVDPDRLIEVLSGGLAGNRVMEVRRRNFLEHDFTPGFRLELHHKDLGIALRTARELGVYVPTTALVDQMLAALKAAGDGGLDHSALLKFIEQASAHEI
ncbi:MAG TPA: 2-hydroxy-3-oxopropionate reductase [Solirubrobacteraceae bacterium]|nr:2-hydroxy-3-oxopropionate reductase [Solirubrobacteraceae bacterium]